MECINCRINLCDVLVCNNIGTISLPAIAEQSGEFMLMLEFESGKQLIKQTFVQGNKLEFICNNLNENYCYTGFAYDPEKNPIIFVNEIGEQRVYFEFCTKQILTND